MSCDVFNLLFKLTYIVSSARVYVLVYVFDVAGTVQHSTRLKSLILNSTYTCTCTQHKLLNFCVEQLDASQRS
ncbi:unnamed protein product [Allacma fusca]|uniref:Uncharacterized protein n=1 Tax=Allacma fusca TaxID=39272 RepID=A0A8J2PGR8_9HEXA|nr:unnamed protein product [Allacma fusca]